MTPQNTTTAYLKSKVLSASPEELRLMLLDGAIKFTMQGQEGLRTRNYEASFNGFSQARNIVMELINSIRPSADPELCERVSALYTFIYTQLVEASFEKDIAKAAKVIELLEYERETWVLLMEKVAAERASEMSRAPGNQPRLVGTDQTTTGESTAKPARISLSMQA